MGYQACMGLGNGLHAERRDTERSDDGVERTGRLVVVDGDHQNVVSGDDVLAFEVLVSSWCWR